MELSSKILLIRPCCFENSGRMLLKRRRAAREATGARVRDLHN
jgi:hypothetical protein